MTELSRSTYDSSKRRFMRRHEAPEMEHESQLMRGLGFGGPRRFTRASGFQGQRTKMVNHPNRSTVYRVQLISGEFAHVVGKYAAIDRAKEMVKLHPVIGRYHNQRKSTLLRVLERDWGVTITRVSASTARSVGL
jgi:hypothetical protein